MSAESLFDTSGTLHKLLFMSQTATASVLSVLRSSAVPCLFVEAKYTKENSLVRDILNADLEFDPYNMAHLIPFWDWVKRNDSTEYARAEDVTGWTEPGPDNIHESIMDGEYTPNPDSVAGFIKSIGGPDSLANFAGDYEEGHTQHNFSINNKGKLLPRQTWVGHFCSDAESIAREGFIFGESDPYDLGLTMHKSDAARHSSPGYNFGYELRHLFKNWHTSWNSRRGGTKYGEELVIFQTSGVSATHYGDQEDQVIFWGPHVEWVIAITKAPVEDYDRHSEDDYAVLDNRGRVVYRTNSGVKESPTYLHNTEKNCHTCVAWVMNLLKKQNGSNLKWKLPKV
jgi:hypothetical protein